MVKICVMASHAYLPSFVCYQELGMCRNSKDGRHFWPSLGSRKGLQRSGTHNPSLHHCNEPLKPMSQLLEDNQLVKINSTLTRPVLINVQETHPDSVLFSFGIAEHYTRHEKILQFLISGSTEGEKGELDMSLLSELLGLQALAINVHQQTFASSDDGSCFPVLGTKTFLSFPPHKSFAKNPLLDFAGELACSSKFTVHSNGRVLFRGPGTQMKDLLSIVGEAYLSKNSTKWRKQSLLIPNFSRLASSEAQANMKTVEAVKVAPLKSHEKVKLKPSQKRKNSKKAVKDRDRDLYRKNSFRACESILSLMMDSRQKGGKMAFVSLKKSGPEVPQLLTQFSAGIAGTGLAVIFSVACKVACGKVLVGAPKLVNTSIGLGLVWLSGAVNCLRDTIVSINKSPGKVSLEEEEIVRKVDKVVNEVFFRAAALMAMVLLRLA